MEWNPWMEAERGKREGWKYCEYAEWQGNGTGKAGEDKILLILDRIDFCFWGNRGDIRFPV